MIRNWLFKSKEMVSMVDSANAFNKFYERYPIDTFKSDGERAAALGYFMAGVELVNNKGEFIVYEDEGFDE